MDNLRNLFYEQLERECEYTAECKDGKEITVFVKIPTIKLTLTMPDGVIIIDERGNKE